MTTVAFAFMRSYTIKKELVHRSEDRAMNKKIRTVSLKAKTKSYIVAFVYLLSIPLAYISIYIAYACFIGAAIVFFIPDGIDDETLAEKIIEKNQ
jgi:multidrug transporter EmrE-like cation transporter